jgi:hypothetical protein
MKKLLVLLALFVVVTSLALAAPPYDRTVAWTNPTTYADGLPIPMTDNLVGHVFVCTSPTDNTTCVEAGTSAFNVASWSGTTLLQPVDTTRYWRIRSESKAHAKTSAYSGAASFFLQGTAAPGTTSVPDVQ